MPDESATPLLDLSTIVSDEDARARFALIAAMLEPLLGKTTGELREGIRAVRDIAAKAAGELAPGATTA